MDLYKRLPVSCFSPNTFTVLSANQTKFLQRYLCIYLWLQSHFYPFSNTINNWVFRLLPTDYYYVKFVLNFQKSLEKYLQKNNKNSCNTMGYVQLDDIILHFSITIKTVLIVSDWLNMTQFDISQACFFKREYNSMFIFHSLHLS